MRALAGPLVGALLVLALTLVPEARAGGDEGPGCSADAIEFVSEDGLSRGCVAVDDRGRRLTGSDGLPVRHGAWEELWSPGSKRSSCTWRNGLLHGSCFYFSPMGTSLGQLDFRDGLPHGDVVTYHPGRKGALKAKAVKGNLDGPVRYYGYNGIELVSGRFRQGQRDAAWTFRYPGGSIRSVGSYFLGEHAPGWSCVSADGDAGKVTLMRPEHWRLPDDLALWIQEGGRLLDPIVCSTDEPRARCLDTSTDPDEGVEHCQQALSIDDTDPELWKALAASWGSAGQVMAAVDALSKGAATTGNAELYGTAGAIAARSGWEDWAKSLFERAEKIQPGIVAGNERWAEARRALGVTEGTVVRQGSGFAVAPGVVVTNNHVVEGCSELTLHVGSSSAPATILAADEEDDLALLAFDESVLTRGALPVTPPESVRVAQDVVAVGHPLSTILGGGAQVTLGVVNALVGIEDDPRFIQVSAQIAPGSSGGPLLDVRGNVVGVVVASLDARKLFDELGVLPQNINFAVRAERLRTLLDAEGVDYASGEGRADSREASAEAGLAAVVRVDCGG